MSIQYHVTSWWKKLITRIKVRENRDEAKKNFEQAKKDLDSLKKFPQ